MDEIMLFPLGSIVLPEGRMRLKIIEPRYQRMVSVCSQQACGFGVCLVEPVDKSPNALQGHCGTYVRMVDFSAARGGVFDITVVGVKRFKITELHQDADFLIHALVTWLPNWDYLEMDEEHQVLAEKLREIYLTFPEIGALYEQRFYDDLSWVSQRWLEILPLSSQVFEDLADDFQCQKSLDFITKTIRYVWN